MPTMIIATPPAKKPTLTRSGSRTASTNENKWFWSHKPTKSVWRENLIVDRKKLPFISMPSMPEDYDVKKFSHKLAALKKFASRRFQKSRFNSNSPQELSPRKTAVNVVTPTKRTDAFDNQSNVYSKYYWMKDMLIGEQDANSIEGSTKRICFIEDIFACQKHDDVLLIITNRDLGMFEDYRQYLNLQKIAHSTVHHGGDNNVALQIPATVKHNRHGESILNQDMSLYRCAVHSCFC
jgi:hypothetical protein